MASTSQAASAAHEPVGASNLNGPRASLPDTLPASVSSASRDGTPEATVDNPQPQTPSSLAATGSGPQMSTIQQNSMAPLPAPYNRHQYPVQGFPPQGFNSDARHYSRPQSRSWAYAKFGMTFCIFAAAAVVLGLTCSYLIYSVEENWLHLVNMPVCVASLSWTLASMIVLAVRNKGLRLGKPFREGIHPGAQVGMHLIMWLGWAIAVAITANYGRDLQRQYDRCIKADKNNGNMTDHSIAYSYPDYIYQCQTQYRGNEDRMIHSDIPRLRAMLVFCIGALVLHFALFIGACVDTQHHNINKRARVVYVTGPPPMMMPSPPHGGGWNQPFMASPPPGTMYPLGAMQQYPYGTPRAGPYYGGPPQHHPGSQQQQYHGEKSGGFSSPMTPGYYAPAAATPAAHWPQPTQPHMPPRGYYAPAGGA